ncbi:hypothetical protein WD_0331 [Wolbachia endosymbiont of Drosophila melanogaster]|uniref:hypothetical protein n=1 Tax=Wolbachia TaxID=953 RepID=UPI000023B987|nr:MULTISPECIES: hypothetical protein [Wolbachia]AAS14063.1 hypothetical protein WD_0331 [Wolbachia endosymbiont of Drosophila melanogaster]ERN55861.1 hypothetical protein WMELPOP_02240 [Wolbachia pipientis wMelPop]MCE4149197.1 hypothetical protein [Wolbachia endosymbiont of Drosophila melanogaster]MCE4150600.1 hypothetical protein [Wolbachia endosymbiont of Drosophila melanogaster]QQL95969.1 hypothetical protein GQX71_01615 [Wolbachia endosymbiont of Drosophila melanogaster]
MISVKKDVIPVPRHWDPGILIGTKLVSIKVANLMLKHNIFDGVRERLDSRLE